MSRHVMALLMVLAVAACSPAPSPETGDEAAASEETTPMQEGATARSPAANEVVVHVVCPPSRREAAATVTVNPLHRVIPIEDASEVMWTFETEGGGVVTPSAPAAVDPEEFPWEIDGDGMRWAGSLKPAFDPAPVGTWKYRISLRCGEDEIVFDPHMETRPGG